MSFFDVCVVESRMLKYKPQTFLRFLSQVYRLGPEREYNMAGRDFYTRYCNMESGGGGWTVSFITILGFLSFTVLTKVGTALREYFCAELKNQSLELLTPSFNPKSFECLKAIQQEGKIILVVMCIQLFVFCLYFLSGSKFTICKFFLK